MISKSPKLWVRALCEWYARVHRPLPWRASQDAYRIWLSEVMLQQTQVVTVIPYYEKFLRLFPTVGDLARADEQTVLHAWAGLGYYSRARNLRKAAQYIEANHGGVFPQTVEELRAVPGIGPYTAGAVSSIAFDRKSALVDGNVQRVFARFFAVKERLGTRAADQFFWRTAQEWVDTAESPRIFNQALMELGATLCSKANPRCALCPLKKDCRAHALGQTDRFPVPKLRRATEKLWWASLVYEKRGKFWVEPNPEGRWWAGLWDFPRLEGLVEGDIEPQVLQRLEKQAPLKLLNRQEHTVTHHRIHVAPVVLGFESKSRSGPGRWVTAEEADGLPLSSLAKKVLGAYRNAK